MKLRQIRIVCRSARLRWVYLSKLLGFDSIDVENSNCFASSSPGRSLAFFFDENKAISCDSVDEALIELPRVENVLDRAKAYGSTIRIASNPRRHVIDTPVGNFKLSFIRSGTLDAPKSSSSHHDDLEHVDHVTLALTSGSSNFVSKWFEKCLGFRRFWINDKEMDEGYVIRSEKSRGIRLLGMELAGEKTSSSSSSSSFDDDNFKIVLAEPLPGSGRRDAFFLSFSKLFIGPNQIDTFLKEHGSPGVQHLAFHTSNIIQCIQRLKGFGMEFIPLPSGYYMLVSSIINDVQYIISVFYIS